MLNLHFFLLSSSGSISLTSISLSVLSSDPSSSSSSSSFSCSFISVISNGELIMNNIHWLNLSLSSPLISLHSSKLIGSFSLSHSSFRSFENKERRKENEENGEEEEEEGRFPPFLSSSGGMMNVEMENVEIEGNGGEERTKGGGMLFDINNEGNLVFSSSSFSSCFCSSTEGKGGGMYLYTTKTPSFSFSSLSFSSNIACIGHDVFLSVVDLVEIVLKPSSFPFKDEIENKDKGMWGEDLNQFRYGINLFSSFF
jgi:hypothetical protein